MAIPQPLLKAYLADFGGKTGSAAEFAKIPFRMFDRFLKGNWSERADDHGYSAEQRLSDAIYRRLKRRRIDAILEEWRAAETKRQSDAEAQRGEEILSDMNGHRPALITANPNTGEVEVTEIAAKSYDLTIGKPLVARIPVGSEKKCRDCGQVKPITEYWKNRVYPDGHEVVCRDCRIAHRDEQLRARGEQPPRHYGTRQNRRTKAEIAAGEPKPDLTLTFPLTPKEEEPSPYAATLEQLALARAILADLPTLVEQIAKEGMVELPALRTANEMLVQANAGLRLQVEEAKKETQEVWALIDTTEADKLREENGQLFTALAQAREEKSTILREVARLRSELALLKSS